MKPTQEQVIAWAREAGVYHIAPNVAGSLLYMSQQSLYRGFFLAYEAGRKDENEACEQICKQRSQIQLDERVMRAIDECVEDICTRREQ